MVEAVFSCAALIFDLDGVLVDSQRVIQRYWRHWAAQHGLDAAEILHAAQGMRTVDTIRLVAPHLDAEAEAAGLAGGEALDMDGVVPVRGAKELLLSIPPDRWAVATSGSRRTATARLQHTALPMPHVLVTADDVGKGKPDPEVYLLAAQRLGTTAQESLVVEDTQAGIQAALRAGMRVVAVASSFSPEHLRAASAIAPSLEDIRVVSPPEAQWEDGLQVHVRLHSLA
ncbi:MAG: HAD-IA family hydrolase [Anaerolineales bacterium]|nr:HAD-IA family hydrolase [Anaerolineales bacterium]